MQERLKELMLRENLTASQLAKIMDVNPSTISHITIGRSSPKIDFIQKLLISFPRINPDWVILGVGEMYKKNQEVRIEPPKEPRVISSLFDDLEIESSVKVPKPTPVPASIEAPIREVQEPISHPVVELIKNRSERKIDHLLIFYNDSTYEKYVINK